MSKKPKKERQKRQTNVWLVGGSVRISASHFSPFAHPIGAAQKRQEQISMSRFHRRVCINWYLKNCKREMRHLQRSRAGGWWCDPSSSFYSSSFLCWWQMQIFTRKEASAPFWAPTRPSAILVQQIHSTRTKFFFFLMYNTAEWHSEEDWNGFSALSYVLKIHFLETKWNFIHNLHRTQPNMLV